MKDVLKPRWTIMLEKPEVDAFDEAETGWYYDMSDRIVKVKCKKPQKDDFEIVVSCEKFDLIGMENEI